MRSNAASVSFSAAAVRRSWPAAWLREHSHQQFISLESFDQNGPRTNAWHVSRQTPTRVLSSTKAMMSRRSSQRDPMTLPVPAMFSRTVVTVRVLRWALFRAAAMRPIASGRGWGPVDPGLPVSRLKRKPGDDTLEIV